MKKRNRIFAMLMALAMVFAYMPALAFADETEESAPAEVTEEAVIDDAVEVDKEAHEADLVEPEITVVSEEAVNTSVEQFSFTPYYSIKDSLNFDEGDIITIDGVTYTYSEYYDSEDDDYYYDFLDSEGNMVPYYVNCYSNASTYYLNDGAIYQYTVGIFEDPDEEILIKSVTGFNARLHDTWKRVWINGLRYELNNSYNAEAGVWDVHENFTGHATVQPTVVLSDGIAHPVTYVYGYSQGMTSISIPATVTKIEEVGLYDQQYDDNDNLISWKVRPGFTIFGTFGSPAHAYAAKYGIAFRDLEAERQGTIGAGMQKVKITKPAVKKNAITIKWKKLTKKQLKKSKATHYEIWVSTDPNFPAGATIEKTVKKSKASLKVKGLKKNTKYYVRVRSLKYVNGQKVTGKWSKKTIKTKKK